VPPAVDSAGSAKGAAVMGIGNPKWFFSTERSSRGDRVPAVLLLLLLLGLWSEARAGEKLEVRIDGVSGELLDNVKAYLDIEAKKGDPDLTTGWIRRMHRAAPKEIQKALQPFGYFSVKVEPSLTEGKAGWLARYRIDLGPKARVREVQLRVTGPGADESEVKAAIAAFPVREGEALDMEAYDTGKADLLGLLNRLGYAKAMSPLHQIRVYPGRNEAGIHLDIKTGEKYYLGEVTLRQDLLDPGFLRRYVEVEPGDLYSQANLLSLQSDLVRSQFFSVVDVTPSFKRAEEQRVPVDVDLQPADRHKVDLGLGYYTDIGITGSMQWRWRPLNRFGHSLNSLLKLSQVKSTALLSYWIPVRDPRTDKLAATVRYEHEDSTSQLRDTFDLRGGFYSLRWGWNTSLFTEAKYESFTTGSQPETTSVLISFGGSLERTQVDQESRFPTRGNYWFLELKGSPGIVSDTAYLRANVKTRWFIPLSERGRLNVASEVGAAWVADFDRYPSSLRFYAGGDQSVRGYKYQALGPKDAEGEVAGGKHLVTGSIEYDHRVLEDWVGAVFVDGGNAFDDELDKLFYSAGVGVRWLSPMGPVRLDFAVPINRDEGNDTEWRIHFGFGAEL
jgi:translocation and assembly module TamA